MSRPTRYVAAIITERGIARAPYAESLRGLWEAKVLNHRGTETQRA